MIDRRAFLGSLAVSTLIAARSVAPIPNDKTENTLSVDSRARLLGPRPLPDAILGVHRCVVDLNGA
jgi:hypothetical protein